MAELSPRYVMKRMLIDKSTIKNFITNEEDRRKIRDGKVKELLRNLNQECHFSSPIVVNERTTDKFYLIDGNHRIEAIKLKLGIDKEFKINVWCAVYRELNKEMERAIFVLWNIGVTQSSTDFLKLYWKTIPCGEEILKRLPVTIYGDKTHINVKLLVGNYINIKKQKMFEGGYGASRETVIGDFCGITSEDIDVIKEFSDFMKDTFGSFSLVHLFYKSTPFSVIMRIWYDNRDNKKLKKIFKREFSSKIELWEQNGKAGGREACKMFYDLCKLHLKKYLLLWDTDIVPKKDKEREILEMVKKNKK